MLMSRSFNFSNISVLPKVVLLDVSHCMKVCRTHRLRGELVINEYRMPAVLVLKDHLPDPSPEVDELNIYVHP